MLLLSGCMHMPFGLGCFGLLGVVLRLVVLRFGFVVYCAFGCLLITCVWLIVACLWSVLVALIVFYLVG